MNTPFTLNLSVKEENCGSAPTLGIDTYQIRTTLSHKIGDIRGEIWRRSQDYRLKPMFVNIFQNETKLYDEQTFASILNTQEVPTEEVWLQMVIDYLLFNLPFVPVRDPPEELFDISILWENDNGREASIRIRESIDCTVGTLQDYISEERSKSLSSPRMNREYFGLVLQPSGEYVNNSSLLLREVLGLDVTPIEPVVFRIRFNLSEEVAYCRFHIKIESSIPQLQQHNLIEVNNRTTVAELKEQLITRMDEESVRRTFVDQLELSYAAHVLENTPAVNLSHLYDVLNLNLNLLYEHGNIIVIYLLIISEDGILSRLFWNDLRSPGRFEFLPGSAEGSTETTVAADSTETTDSTEATGSTPNALTEPTRTSHPPFTPVEPMKIVLDSGEQWQLTGESYEMINRKQSSSTDTKQPPLLVNQSDLSSVLYNFSLEMDGVEKSSLVSTSQCIIVDKGDHPAYVLLSPSGIAKLDSQFRNTNGSIIQQVQVLLHPAESHLRPSSVQVQDESHHRQPAAVHIQNEHMAEQENHAVGNRRNQRVIDKIYQYIRQNYRNIGARILRYGGIFYVFSLDKILFRIWQPMLTNIVVFGMLIYIFFFSGTRVTDTLSSFLPERQEGEHRRYDEVILARMIVVLQMTNSILGTSLALLKEEIIMTAVKRTREFDLFMIKIEGNDTFFNSVKEAFTNLWKDILLFFLSCIPSLHGGIEECVEAWRQAEIEDLETEVRVFQELIIEIINIYDKKNDINDGEPARNVILRETSIDYDQIQPTGNLEETEVRYQQLLHYYIQLQPVYDKFDKCVREGKVLDEGRRRLADAGDESTRVQNQQ